MSRYIDADELKSAYAPLEGCLSARTLGHMKLIFDALVDSMPAADVVEVRHGRWIYLGGLDAFECSVCGRQMVRNIFDYCPWCGALMDEVEE